MGRILTILAAVVLFTVEPVFGQSSTGRPKDIEPWMHERILDKGKIAEKTYQRIHGLDEDGNPRRVGTVLENATTPEPDPRAREERRQRQIKLLTSRKLDWSAPPQPKMEAEVAPDSAAAASDQPESSRSPLPWFLVAGFVGLFYWLYRRN